MTVITTGAAPMTQNSITPATESGWHSPFWEKLIDDEGHWRKDRRVAGEHLTALRRGVDRDPGTVPQMWPFYTTLNAEGRLTFRLRAEHLALTLFGIHQQSRPRPMHRPGVGFGAAMAALRANGKFSVDAVDRRVGAAATATSLSEVGIHVRGLVTQLKTIDQPLDYTKLMKDFTDWQSPDTRGRILRRWGGDYFQGRASAADDE